jgi:hypothetical protein
VHIVDFVISYDLESFNAKYNFIPVQIIWSIMNSAYCDMTESERQVSEYLTKLDLNWLFQFPVFVYDDKKRPRVWTPDFYVPKLGMYIEVAGSRAFDYKYRQKVYVENGIPVIFIHFYKDKERWKNYFIVRMKEIEEARYQEVMKMVVLDKM